MVEPLILYHVLDFLALVSVLDQPPIMLDGVELRRVRNVINHTDPVFLEKLRDKFTVVYSAVVEEECQLPQFVALLQILNERDETLAID